MWKGELYKILRIFYINSLLFSFPTSQVFHLLQIKFLFQKSTVLHISHCTGSKIFILNSVKKSQYWKICLAKFSDFIARSKFYVIHNYISSFTVIEIWSTFCASHKVLVVSDRHKPKYNSSCNPNTKFRRNPSSCFGDETWYNSGGQIKTIFMYLSVRTVVVSGTEFS